MITFGITLLLLFGPGVLAVVGLHRTLHSPHTHVRVIGASMAAVFVAALAGLRYRADHMDRYFRTPKPGVLLSDVPFSPSYVMRAEKTGLPVGASWLSPSGDLAWSATIDELTGHISDVGAMWMCGTTQTNVYISALFAAGALVVVCAIGLARCSRGWRRAFFRVRLQPTVLVLEGALVLTIGGVLARHVARGQGRLTCARVSWA